MAVDEAKHRGSDLVGSGWAARNDKVHRDNVRYGSDEAVGSSKGVDAQCAVAKSGDPTGFGHRVVGDEECFVHSRGDGAGDQ